MQDVTRASVPFPDNQFIEYPDADWWRYISEKRIKRWGRAVDLFDRDPKTRQILEKLDEPISMSFANETPLDDVLKYIKQATTTPTFAGIPIYVDPLGLQEAERSLNSTVQIDLEGVPLKTTLRLILKQLGLTYTVKDGYMMITSEESEDKQTEIRVYPVADLAIIPMSLMMGGGGGMGGGMGGMGGGMMGGGMGGMGGGMGGGMMGGNGWYGRHGRRHDGRNDVRSTSRSPGARGRRERLFAKKKQLTEALQGNPSSKSSPKSQGQRGGSPAGPSSLQGSSRDGGPAIRPMSPGGSLEMAPLIRPRGAKGQDLIVIEGHRPSSLAVTRPSSHTDPLTFWMNFYRTKDEKKADPESLRETVALLNFNGKSRDIEAALRGYLTHQGKHRETWMYEALALAIEMNRGPASDVKTSLGYAADLAQRTHNPNFLVSVASMLFMRGYYDRVGALLDEAADKVPHRAEPLAMSVNLAQKTKDPLRMSAAIDRLLSLGWPGQDEYFRVESRNQAEILAKTLREDGRSPEADAMLAKLTESEARDVFIRLTWDGSADYDLAVEEPLGVTASYQMPRTVFGGSVIKNGYGSHPEEVYVCPRGFDGDYTVRVSTIWTDPSKPVTSLTLETIAHEGTAQEQKTVYKLPPQKFNKPFVLHLSGGRRKKVLPFIDPRAALVEAAQEQAKKNLKTGKGARGTSKKPSSNDAQPKPSAKEAVKPKF